MQHTIDRETPTALVAAIAAAQSRALGPDMLIEGLDERLAAMGLPCRASQHSGAAGNGNRIDGYGFMPAGATCSFFNPMSSNALRTRPDALASSMNVLTYASAAGLPLGTATAVVEFKKPPSSVREPGILASSPPSDARPSAMALCRSGQFSRLPTGAQLPTRSRLSAFYLAASDSPAGERRHAPH